VETSATSSTVSTIAQHVVKSQSDPKMKRDLLRDLVRSQDNIQNAIVFANRKTTVALLEKSMRKHGFNAGALHGDMDQSARLAMLQAFRSSEVTFLIASDVAARGLDIPEVSHVFNFDVPIHAEDYVHRIGRTGRAGREGHAFMLVGREDSKHHKAIEALIKKEIPWFSVGKAEVAETTEAVAEKPAARERRPARSKPAPRQTAPVATEEKPVAARTHEPRAMAQKQPEQRSQRPPRNPRQNDDAPDHHGFNQVNMPAFLAKPVRA